MLIDITCSEIYRGGDVKQLIKIFIMLEPAPLLGAMWFLSALFYTLIGYDVLVRMTDKFRYQVIILSVVATGMLIIGLNVKMPRVLINNILEAFFFVHCGFMYKNAIVQRTIKKLYRLFGVSLVAVFVIAKYNTVSFATNTYGSKALFLAASFCGIVATLFGSELIENCKIFNWLIILGQNTIGVVIWQFVSFKLVSLIQIAYYGLSIDRLNDYPVIYEYAITPWIIANTVVGIIISIFIYKALNTIFYIIWQQGKNRL